MDNHQEPQRGWNWGLILLVIVMLALWSGAMASAYKEWSAT